MHFKSGTLGFDNEPEDGIILLDVNCQGIKSICPAVKTLYKYFPQTYVWYMQSCINDTLTPGECYIKEEADYTLAIFVISEYVSGPYKDVSVEVEIAFDKCFNNLLDRNLKMKNIVSNVPGLPYSILPHCRNKAIENNLNWTIYKD